ncbi:3-carboxy-cis,cis-muconate cycloisomerase [Streptomyces sp. NBC_00996]|uniref:3-carboxy-cis,cis-muconate cycloisomerase n=1 Tax=Streptomyces sp. NBC_00996 TaxID=2903710 RepID=UPI00387088BD|nr:3-carboxy-cis,cis-muconate cycloisomerase [Streptomyces sp. NBC_00996]
MTAVDPVDSGALLAPGWAGCPAASETSDTAYLRALLDAEAALARAQASLALAPAEAASAVSSAADATVFDIAVIALRARSGGNPVIPLVADLTAAVGKEYGPYVHRGATSQDIMDSATMLVTARTLDLVLGDLGRTERALARLAAEHRDTVMPGRTLTQHAVPTTFGLKAAGWRSLVLDARDRVSAVRASLPAQLGGAAGTLAAFTVFGPAGTRAGGGRPALADTQAASDASAPADTQALIAAYARELGLAPPVLPWHTLRTPIADLAGALAFTAGALGKTAVDVLTLTRTEIAEVAEGSGGGSSAMPHKANPVRATLVAAAARRAPQLAATLYGAMAAEDERPAGAWHAEWEPLRDLLRLVGGAARDAAELAEGLRVNADTMREHLGLTHGLIVSERLAAELAPVLGRARAKELLTRAAQRAVAGNRPLVEVLGEEPELKELDLADLTDPTRYTGSAGALTDRALERR